MSDSLLTPHGDDLNKDLSSLPIAGRKKHLHEDMDAQRWTREFMENNPNAFRAEIDEGTMLAWFSNAIMCGYDEAMRRAASSETKELHVIFDAGPGPEGGRFVEVETPEGKSVNVGEWRERPDGLWALVLKGVS